MPQGLSAMKYIRNNKRRVSVLIVSLVLCFVLFYIVKFLLSVTAVTFQVMTVGNAERIQYVGMPSSELGLYSEDFQELGEEKFWEAVHVKRMELTEKLENQNEILKAYYTDVYWFRIHAIVGEYNCGIPMVPLGDFPQIMEHFDAVLTDGRLPEREGEILLDQKCLHNGGYAIGDTLQDYKTLRIVGVMESPCYLALGGKETDKLPDWNPTIVTLSQDAAPDISSILNDLGYESEPKNGFILDYKHMTEELQTDIIDAISGSTKAVFVTIACLVSISILILYTSYLRDRRNEWCLYASIGFSRKSIYSAVMRELLFTFGLSLGIGGILTAILVAVMDRGLVEPLGLQCEYWLPQELLQILCVFLTIFSILQIPIQIALYKIRTIDGIDDDLN